MVDVAGNFAEAESFFEGQGFTTPQAQGIAAGLFAESGLNPSAVNPDSGATGLAQDLGPRLTQMLSGDTSFEGQLANIQSEFGTSAGGGSLAAIQQQTTAQGAADAFINLFERPGAAGAAGDSTRAATALNNFAGGGASLPDDQFSEFTGNLSDISEPSALGSLGVGEATAPIVTGSAGTADFDQLPDNIFDGADDPVAATTSLTGAAGGATAGAGGTPITITDLPATDTAITGAGKAVQAGAGTIGSDVTSAAGGITGTAASAINSLEMYTSSTFVVVAIAIMGIVFVAFGLGFFKPKQVLSVL
jgi:Phage tail lysozyme